VLLHKGARIRRLIFATTLLSAVFSYTQPTEEVLDCLNLVPQEGVFSLRDHRDKCFRDQLDFSNVAAVQDTEKLFGLSASDIGFVGCDIAPFSARIDQTELELHFQVLYNSALDRSASTM
jgi:hypothetical protein